MKRDFLKSALAVLIFVTGFAEAAESCRAKSVQYGARSGDVVNAFTVSEYRVTGEVQKSLIILPPTGGTNVIDRSYADIFCFKGYDVYIINDWPRPGENTTDLELHQKFYANAQKAVALVIAQIKTPFIGMLGTSVGALHASVAANTFEKLNAVFLIVGGLPISEVIVTSDQKAMRDLHEIRKQRFHFKNDQENIGAIDKVFALEPSTLGSMYKNKDIGVVLANGDTTVPTINQIKLRDFFHPIKEITLSNDHFWAIVKTWLFHTGDIVAFFEQSSVKRAP